MSNIRYRLITLMQIIEKGGSALQLQAVDVVNVILALFTRRIIHLPELQQFRSLCELVFHPSTKLQ